MAVVGKLGKCWARAGLMPNPKLGHGDTRT
jgi:ribosomal protein L1